MQRHPLLFDRIEKLENIRVHRVDGGHHLHLESQAPEVATILDSFYRNCMLMRQQLLLCMLERLVAVMPGDQYSGHRHGVAGGYCDAKLA